MDGGSFKLVSARPCCPAALADSRVRGAPRGGRMQCSRGAPSEALTTWIYLAAPCDPPRQLKASQDKWFDLLGEDGLREQEAIVIKCEKLCADLGSSVSADVLSVEHGAREARTCVQARERAHAGPVPAVCARARASCVLLADGLARHANSLLAARTLSGHVLPINGSDHRSTVGIMVTDCVVTGLLPGAPASNRLPLRRAFRAAPQARPNDDIRPHAVTECLCAAN